ncbi:MAG TPA: class I SAM-dependent methyltransferase, partial [Rhodospirillales bacterium]|nr:class I SAM-dependent methyltransferase [Rhodospirillales bacterium]
KAKNEGLTDLIDFYLRDYRDQAGTFERIVSVGMFEHVGIGHFPNFFMTYKNLLADNGIALLHTIGRSSPPSVTDPWVRKYIFPGGYIPALSEVLPAIEKTGLIVTDVEILHAHYAETIRHWRARFNANRDRIKTIYDERFCRMWEFYLASSEVSFRFLGMTVFQIQMVKKSRLLPLKRDYIEKLENEM